MILKVYQTIKIWKISAESVFALNSKLKMSLNKNKLFLLNFKLINGSRHAKEKIGKRWIIKIVKRNFQLKKADNIKTSAVNCYQSLDSV